MRTLPWLALLLLVGCSARRPPLLGVVRYEGGVTLDVRGSVLPVRGKASLLAELAALDGARIAARARPAGGGLAVAGYELLEGPDGLPAYAGGLVVDQGGVRLVLPDGTALLLRAGDLETLRSLHGAKLWVTGTIVGPQTLLVAHWGALSPPDAADGGARRSPGR